MNNMTWNADALKAYHADLMIEPSIQSVPRVDSELSPPVEVKGIGYIDSEGGSLDRVLFVPDSDVNLVSVSQLTRDRSVRVVFHQDVFWVEKLQNSERIGCGHKVGSTYVVTRLDVGAADHWILDTFASCHYTHNPRMLDQLLSSNDVLYRC